jgi:hypothetical protein
MIHSTQNGPFPGSFRALKAASNLRNNFSLGCGHDLPEQCSWLVGTPGMRVVGQVSRVLLFLTLIFLVLPACSSPVGDRQSLEEALGWFRNSPGNVTQYNYVMTARLRLLFFWVGKDDVGGGYIRRGVSEKDPRMEFIQVLFGSDPAKAPRAINRWGAGTEISWHQAPVTADDPRDDVISSAFFGFMKSSSGKSVSEMKTELEREKKEGLHDFKGILTRVEPSSAFSLVVPLASKTDYNLNDYARAEPVMLQTLEDSARPVRSLDEPATCRRAAEFLATIGELIETGLQQHSAPVSRCYIHNAEQYTLALQRIEPLESLNVHVRGLNDTTLVDQAYHRMVRLDFVSTHKPTGRQSEFSIYTATQGPLRGVPVQIAYEPNWWFQVLLNLLPKQTATARPAH